MSVCTVQVCSPRGDGSHTCRCSHSHILYLSPHFTFGPCSQCSWSGYERCMMLSLPAHRAAPRAAPAAHTAAPLRVLPAAVCLLSMKHPARPLCLYSSTCFHRSALFFLSGFFPSSSSPLSLPPYLSHPPCLSLTLSPSRCIHFCAFKKSPRITNLEESELRVTEEG